MKPLLDVKNLQVHFAVRTGLVSTLLGKTSQVVRAVDGVDFSAEPGGNPLPGGRIGKREDHHGAKPSCAWWSPPAGRNSFRGRTSGPFPGSGCGNSARMPSSFSRTPSAL
jgi:hypothetical protein